jgi:hypothetical protein
VNEKKSQEKKVTFYETKTLPENVEKNKNLC